MTLAEAYMDKHMAIDGWIGNEVDLAELWFKIYFCKKTHISGLEGVYGITFRGPTDYGGYVLMQVVEAVRTAQTKCHLEVSYYYEDPAGKAT